MSLKLAQLIYLATLAFLAIAYFMLPAGRPVVVVCGGATGAGAIALGVARWRPQRWVAWLLIAWAVVPLNAGYAVVAVVGARIPFDPVRFVGVADAFFLASYLPLTVGLLWLGMPRVPSREWPVVLDVAVLSLACALPMWIWLVRPALVDLHLTGAGLATAVAMWVGHVALLAATARVVLVWRTNGALALLGAGMVARFVSGLLLFMAVVNAAIRGGGPVNLGLIGLGYLAFSGLCGAAALKPSMAQAASVSQTKRHVGPGRLAIMAAGLLVGPTALFIEAASGTVTNGAGIAIVSAAVGILVLVRLWMFSRAYRRRAHREHAMRMASRALVMATTPGDVINGLTAALAEMATADTWLQVQLVDRGGPYTREAKLSPNDNTAAAAASGGRLVGELTVPIHSQASTTGNAESETKPSQVMVFTAAIDELVELSPRLQTLTEQAGSAMDRIDLVARVRAAEREHYFRTLVLTSTDATLISRDGRIDYATPSAETTFGRDVRGALFADLVYHHPPGHADANEPWSDEEEGVEGYVHRSDGTALTVLVHRRDLTADPTVHGVVTTLRDMTAEREAQRHLAYRASHDALTGLANADRFHDELHADNDAAVVANALSAVLFVDLDDFKSVNDTFGHEIGDGLLRTAAHRIRSSLRDGDVAARLGGDEFAVLLRDVPNPDVARAVTQRLSDNLASPATVAGVSLDCQASIGLALARTTGDHDSVLRRADTALYTAKAAGKGSWQQYQDTMLNPVRRRADQRATLKNLIRHDELTVHYQPIVELATGRTAGFEALLRTIRPAVDGDLPTSVEQLVRTAEETRLMVQLGDRVLAQALTDVFRFNPPRTGYKRYVSANVSAFQLRQRNFVEHVRDLMATSGTDPSLLVLEIAENLLINADEREWAYLRHLRHDGVRVAIDDYGTGYAAVSYLRQTGIDIVKIDRRLVRNIQSARTQTLLDAVITLAINLGLDAIAEGVDDRQTRDTLVALGCRYGQGILYAPAMPIGKAIMVSGYPRL